MLGSLAKAQVEVVAETFASYLKHERGLAPRTIKYHQRFVVQFLSWRFGKRGVRKVNLARIQGGDLVTFVQREATKRSAGSARMITAALLFREVLALSRCSSAEISCEENTESSLTTVLGGDQRVRNHRIPQ